MFDIDDLGLEFPIGYAAYFTGLALKYNRRERRRPRATTRVPLTKRFHSSGLTGHPTKQLLPLHTT